MKKNSILRLGASLAVLAVVFLLGISAGMQYAYSPEAASVATDNVFQASVMIDYGNGTVKTYDFTDISGGSLSVFNILEDVTRNNGIELQYKDYGGDLGVFIESINGIGKDPTGKKWWQYWINNTYSQVGASSRKAQPGDIIEFKFITGQE